MHRLLNTKLLSRCSSILYSLSKIPKSSATRRFIQSCSKTYQMPKTPDLIYMPHFLRWFKSKLRFKYLKRIWDPDFSEGAFIYGSTRAVCRITEIINNGNVEELDNLMTLSARIKLVDDMNYKLTSVQKKIIVIKPEDIKILVPVTVTLNKEGPGKLCKINIRVLALKWHEVLNATYKLVLIALQTEFSRDYSENAPQEWNVSGFSILECTLLSEATATKSE